VAGCAHWRIVSRYPERWNRGWMRPLPWLRELREAQRMSTWRQFVAMTVLICGAGIALWLAVGPARHRAQMQSIHWFLFLFLVADMSDYIGNPAAPRYVDISAWVAVGIAFIAGAIAWNRAKSERPAETERP